MSSLVYSTGKVVKIPSKLLYSIHLIIFIFICIYIIGYGIFWCKGYQTASHIESVVVTKVKGVLKTTVSDKELGMPNPELYKRVWDASDISIPHQGEESGGFFILTNLVITANQTRGTCAESAKIVGARCKIDKDCTAGKALPLGNGFMTGKCVKSSSGGVGLAARDKTCEIEAWCPVEYDKLPLNENQALLEGTKEFTVLVKNSIEFTDFGEYYKRRNILDGATKEYLQNCLYNAKTDPFCPTFRLGDIVLAAKESYPRVALTGAVFALRIEWFCEFDFGKSLSDCRPRYSFARLDNPKASLAPGFNFLSATYHEENRRTLTRNYGLKFIIDVDGEGRKLDPVKLILAIGASVGLFALASKICDFVLGLLCKLQNYFDWPWLHGYTSEMKYDLRYLNKAQFSIGDNKSSDIELDEVEVLKHKRNI